MDDEKKEGGNGVSFALIAGLFVVLAAAPSVLSVASDNIAMYFSQYVGYWEGFVSGVQGAYGIAIAIAIPLCLVFAIGIVYCVERIKQVRRKEEVMYDIKIEPAFEEIGKADTKYSDMWQRISANIASENENDWKQAIIEADVILDELLTRMGYRGESVGEKLKRVEKGDMETLDDAWEAHKVRNSIAHGHTGFTLNHHEAKQTIQLYKKVFEEFYYV